jgi:hypothetical protein
MSQLQALQKLYVGANKLQYSDVEFVIESFPQLTTLAINGLGLTGQTKGLLLSSGSKLRGFGLTGQFAFRKSRTS